MLSVVRSSSVMRSSYRSKVSMIFSIAFARSASPAVGGGGGGAEGTLRGGGGASFEPGGKGGVGVPIGSAYLSARRTYRLGVLIGSAYLSARRTIGRPKVRFNLSPPPCFGRKNGRKVRFNPSPPLVVIPPYTNNPPKEC